MLDLLLAEQRFVITTHIRPDGDAIGSELALHRFLTGLGKDVAIINSDPAPYNLGWMPGIDHVDVFSGSLRQREQIGESDVILVVDTNALDRIGRLAKAVQASTARKVLIDHHTKPESWFDAQLSRDTASSTGELVYELIAAHDPGRIDPEMATALYAAIMTDTGSFRFNSVTPGLHRIVADLLERGDLNPEPIHVALFDSRSMEGLRLLGLALESITRVHGNRVAYMVVSQQMVRSTGASLEETEGFVNYALSIEGVQVAIIFTEIDAGIKMSFRSKAETHVNAWARAFGGGGHRNASGAFVKGGRLDEVIDEVVAAAPRFIDVGEPDPKADDLSDEDASYLDALLKAGAARS